ncbi:hypothetical protein D3C72_1501170 [compost metagenome]
MHEGGARVHTLLVFRQDPRHHQVDRQADEGDDEDHAALHGLRGGKAQYGFIADPADHAQHGQAVDEGGQRLGAAKAERVARRGRASRDQLRQQGQAQRGRVRDHVARIGNQGQRIGQETGDDLDAGKRQGQPQRPREDALAAPLERVGVLGVAFQVGVQMGGVVFGVVVRGLHGMLCEMRLPSV